MPFWPHSLICWSLYGSTGVCWFLLVRNVPLAKELLWGFLTHSSGVWVITFLAIFLGEQLRLSREVVSEIRAQFRLLEKMAGNMLQSLPAGVLTINTDNLVVFSNTIANILLTGENKTLGGQHILEVMPKLAECLQADNPRQQFELRLGKTRIPYISVVTLRLWWAFVG